MYASAAMFTATDSAKMKNGTFAMRSTSSQMRKMTLIQNAHGLSASSAGSSRTRQLYQTMFATSAIPMAMTAGQ